MARHGLLNRAWRDPVVAAGDLCGLHAQVPTTPPLSLWCRLADFDRTTLDAAYWSGLKVSEMRPVLHELKPHLVEVTVEGQRGRYWLCRQDMPALLNTDAAQPVPLRLLPRFDPLLLGHKDKRQILSPAHRSRVFRPAGEVTATLLVDGRVAATWRAARERQTLAITLQPFASLPVDVLDQCQREGTSLASFMGLQNVRLEVVEE